MKEITSFCYCLKLHISVSSNPLVWFLVYLYINKNSSCGHSTPDISDLRACWSNCVNHTTAWFPVKKGWSRVLVHIWFWVLPFIQVNNKRSKNCKTKPPKCAPSLTGSSILHNLNNPQNGWFRVVHGWFQLLQGNHTKVTKLESWTIHWNSLVQSKLVWFHLYHPETSHFGLGQVDYISAWYIFLLLAFILYSSVLGEN